MTSVQLSTVASPLAGAPSAQPSAPASPAADATARKSAEPTDIVSLSPAAVGSLHMPLSADDAAADCQAAVEGLQGAVDHLNGFGDFLSPKSMQIMRDALGDEAAEKWAEGIKQHIADTEKALTDQTSYVAQTYGVSGTLPSKDQDGTWSAGSFTLSRSGSGYAVRASNDGSVQISRNGGAYQAWTPPPGWGSAGTDAGAQAALKALEQIRTAAKAGGLVGSQAQAQVLALFKRTA